MELLEIFLLKFMAPVPALSAIVFGLLVRRWWRLLFIVVLIAAIQELGSVSRYHGDPFQLPSFCVGLLTAALWVLAGRRLRRLFRFRKTAVDAKSE